MPVLLVLWFRCILSILKNFPRRNRDDILPTVLRYQSTVEKSGLKVAAPHVLVLLICIAYLTIGAFVFQQFEKQSVQTVANDTADLNAPPSFNSYSSSLLFCFISISTIGWGNMFPTTFGSRLFCIFYSTLGIPLLLLGIADIGKFITKGCWWILNGFSNFVHRGSAETDHRDTTNSDKPLPVLVILLLLGIYVVLGGCLFYYSEMGYHEDWTFFKANYLSFISITTIGYGDIFPKNTDYNIPVMFYLLLGMALMSTFLAALGEYLQTIHYLGRRVRGAKNVDVWFGGETLSVSQLLTLIADQFKVSPEHLQEVLHKLDVLVEAALEQKQQSRESSRVGTPTRTRKRTISGTWAQLRHLGRRQRQPPRQMDILELSRRLGSQREMAETPNGNLSPLPEQDPEMGNVLEALSAIAKYSLLLNRGESVPADAFSRQMSEGPSMANGGMIQHQQARRHLSAPDASNKKIVRADSVHL